MERLKMGVKNKLDEIRDSDGKLPAYAWPGGYQMFYVDTENNILCPDCANAPGYSTGPVDVDINWEDPDLFCDNCGRRIESAYAED
jgi:hypothetical protein